MYIGGDTDDSVITLFMLIKDVYQAVFLGWAKL